MILWFENSRRVGFLVAKKGEMLVVGENRGHHITLLRYVLRSFLTSKLKLRPVS